MTISDTLRSLALGAAVALAASPALAAQEGGRAVLTAASERFESVRGLCAGFEQTLVVTLLDQEKSSRGRLCQLRPNYFRMDFSEPEGDLVVADGEHFWLYYPSQNPGQVIRLPLDPARGGMDFYREFLDNPLGKYEIHDEGTEEVTGVETVRLRLVPRSSRGYREARVWIDPARRLIRRIEVHEDAGTIRRVTLDSIEIDPGLTPSSFSYTPPAGVSVLIG